MVKACDSLLYQSNLFSACLLPSLRSDNPKQTTKHVNQAQKPHQTSKIAPGCGLVCRYEATTPFGDSRRTARRSRTFSPTVAANSLTASPTVVAVRPDGAASSLLDCMRKREYEINCLSGGWIECVDLHSSAIVGRSKLHPRETSYKGTADEVSSLLDCMRVTECRVDCLSSVWVQCINCDSVPQRDSWRGVQLPQLRRTE